jgi:diguanylate cyclase (GGDEF)-like protein
MTGQPNRLFLAENIEFIHSHANRHEKKGALLYIDLDDFKPINDTYGHSEGDKYLQAISIAIKKLLRDSDVLVRLGGDEFVVVLYEISAEDDAIEVANKLLKTLSAEYILDDITVSASASIGIYCFPKAEMTVDNLISAADAAMYNAKQSGKNKYFI